MDLVPVLSAIAFAFLMDSAFNALRLDPRSRLNRVIFALDLDLALWAVDAIFRSTSPLPALQTAWSALFMPTWCLFFGLALHFCLLTSRVDRRLGLAARALIHGPGLVFAALWEARLFSPGFDALFGPPLLGPFDILDLAFCAYYMLWLAGGVGALFAARLRTRSRLERRRLRLLLLSMVLPVSGGFATGMLMPALGRPVPDLTVLWAAGWAFGVRVAISRLGFMAPIRNVGDAGRLFSAFLKKSRDGIVLTDEEGNVAVWNAAMEELTGFAASETLGRPLLEVQEAFRLPSSAQMPAERLERSIDEALEGRPGKWAGRITEYPLHRKDGELRWVRSSAFTIAFSGKRNALAAILRDVSADKAAAAAAEEERRRLEVAEKMEAIGTLAAGLAHDFNNILTGIKGTVSLLRLGDGAGGAAPQAELEEGFGIIDAAAARGSDLVRQLLALAGKERGQRGPVRLSDAVAHALLLTKNGVDPSVAIEVAELPEEAVVHAEAVQVERILINLIINAADSMTTMRAPGEAQGGRITVSAIPAGKPPRRDASEGMYWMLSVRDEGVGIGEDELSRVFDPFYTTKAGGRSHGLGLPTVYAIAESHGGLADLRSEKGKGSEFRVWLPAWPGEAGRDQAAGG